MCPDPIGRPAWTASPGARTVRGRGVRGDQLVRLTVTDDAQARERAHAATRERRPPAHPRGGPYLRASPGERFDLDPQRCRCERPASVAEVDRLSSTIVVVVPDLWP